MHLIKHAVLIVLLALIMAASGCCACCDFTPTPAPGNGDKVPAGYTYGQYYQNDPGPSSEDVRQSEATLRRAAEALDAVDKAGFLECLTAEAQQEYASAEMSADGAKALAAALRNAEIVKQYSDEIVYETEIDGESLYFSTTKEGGEWKIDNI
ncbi:MAG: hypothetical protein A4E28_02744 [Methanocella sp. PtaU1.Bin125]|nr:MAG: hypothetical protein A4E28_02744 [Methanocella sp. PtaU1.Bin125]